jgi:hypothetical protein
MYTTTRRGTVTVSSAEIDRFQSPVCYRVHGNRLLLVPQRIPDAMMDATFQLNKEVIRTPTRASFDLIDFLDAFVKDFNARTEIDRFQSPDIRNTVVFKRLILKKIGGAINA